MLRLLIGTDWKENSRQILGEISQDVLQQRSGRILLVPELISHDTERRLAERAGDTASRFAEVLTFSRIGRRVADAAGCSMEACLDNGGRVVAMAATTRQLHSRLKAYASVENRPEFLTGLLDAVDEFKRCCISAEDLRAASGRTEGAFAQKLEELSLILETYDAITAQGKRDPRDQMTWVLEQMEDTDFAQRHVFYIDGFPDFTRQHFSIVEHLLLYSPCVTIALTCDRPGSKYMAFEKAGKTAADILSFARNNGISVDIQTVSPKDSPLQIMCCNLFQGSAELVPGLSERVSLQQADDIYTECEGAVERILQLVRAGWRYRDIGVVCSDMAAYEDPLRYVFSSCDIPIYRSGTEDVLQKSVMEAILSMLRAALGGFERQDVLRYMKSVLSPLDLGQCDDVENYCILWNVSGTRWLKAWENHPDGLSGEWNQESQDRLSKLNEARERLVGPLNRLAVAFREKIHLNHQVQALCSLFSEIDLAGRLESMADYMDDTGDNRSAQILNQLWEILVGALEQLRDMLGNTSWDTDGFVRLLTLLLSQYDVGTIPTVLDAVLVGPVNAMRCHAVKHLIVLGVQEGSMPTYGGTSGVLSDREREQLRLLNVPLTGGGIEGLQTQFGDIYGVFCSAEDSVLVSCGSDQLSFLFTRIAAMGGELSHYKSGSGFALTRREQAAAYLAGRKDVAGARQLGIEQEFDRISSRASFDMGKVSGERITDLYGKKLNLSASQVDKQADCRFSYFLRYGLRAKELKEATVDPAEFGTYFHAVLERTARRVMELGGFHVVSLEDTLDLALMYSSEYISQRFGSLDSSRVAYLFERNVEELKLLIRELWRELSLSDFYPVQFEVGFGEGKEMPPVPIPGARLDAQLGGFVDRVDKWSDGQNNYFRVVDYKSGKKSFDYCDVFNGMGLQMLLYMFALEQGGEEILGKQPIPVGVQYFSARFPYLQEDYRLSVETADKERGRSLRRKGLVLADENVLSAMQPEGAPDRLMAGRAKDGSITGDVADKRQFHMLRKYVFGILKRLVDEIASGDVSPNPYTRGDSHNACRFCPYGAICHKSTVSGRRNYQAMKPQRFWDEVEREVESNG